MKLAICAQEAGPEARVDVRFGRCAFFVIADTESGDFKSIANPGVTETGGAGPQSAQLLAKEGVDAVAVGNIGPNAIATLNAAEIKVYTGIEGTVRESLQKYNEDKLSLSAKANVSPHFGMN